MTLIHNDGYFVTLHGDDFVGSGFSAKFGLTGPHREEQLPNEVAGMNWTKV